MEITMMGLYAHGGGRIRVEHSELAVSGLRLQA